MSTALKQNEIAAPTEQILPKAKGGIELLAQPPADAKEEIRVLQFSAHERLNLRAESAPPRTANADAGPPLRSADSPLRPGSAEAEMLSRLSRAIQSELRVMRQVRPDRLAVTFRPNAETKIFLQFAIRHGQIEAFARCDRGDFNFFNAHWPELQQSLQQQGVRLLELKEPVTRFFDGGAGGYFGHNNGRGGDERDSSTFSTAHETKEIGTVPRHNGRGRACRLELWA